MADQGLGHVEFSTQELLEYRRLCETAFSKVMELEDPTMWKLRAKRHGAWFYDYCSAHSGPLQAKENGMFERVDIPSIGTSDLRVASEVFINQDYQSSFNPHFQGFERREITPLIRHAILGEDDPQYEWIVGEKVVIQKTYVQRWIYSGQWPVSARDFVVVVAFGWSLADDGNKFYMAQSSIEHPQIKERSGYIRGNIDPSGAVLLRDDNQTVRICQLNSLNFRGILSPWIMKRIQKYNTRHYERLRRYIESFDPARCVMVPPYERPTEVFNQEQ